MAKHGRGQEDADPDGPPSYEDNINESVFVGVICGRNLTEILAEAKERAAKALGSRPENIYIKLNSDLRLVKESRFDPHTPVLWASSVTCGLVPEHLRIG